MRSRSVGNHGDLSTHSIQRVPGPNNSQQQQRAQLNERKNEFETEEHVPEYVEDSLQTIQFELHNVRRRIQVYKGMQHSELQSVIKATFGLHEDFFIVGARPISEPSLSSSSSSPRLSKYPLVDTVKKSLRHPTPPPVVPLSYLTQDPYRFAAQREKYTALRLVMNQPFEIGPWEKFLDFITTHYIFVTTVLIAFFYAATKGYFYAPVYFALDMLDTFLRDIYRNGPQLRLFQFDLGFWNGIDLVDICAQSTGQSSEFWRKNIKECADLYTTKERSWCLLIQMLICIFLIWKMFRAFCILFLAYWFPSFRSVLHAL